ncbi:MAG: flagellar hook assembly protein FlgD [Bdellovibrionales bacterium]
MVSDVNINTALQQQANTEQASTGLAEDFSQFLELLTIQLQNQDPLSPMETTEFTNQLVAFTGVEQQINTNQKLDSLVALQLGNSIGSAIGYVGKEISYVSGELNYDGTNTNTIRYSLNEQAVESTLRILDENGQIVFETNAATAPGQNEFVWDGTQSGGGFAPPGTYSIQIDALNSNDQAITSTAVVSGLVTGVESQNGSIFAIVGERAVSLGNIISVNQPPTPPAQNDSGGSGDSDSDTTDTSDVTDTSDTT